MTKVKIEPGVCRFTAIVSAHSDDQHHVTLHVESECKGIQAMMAAIGDTVDAYQLCFTKPGTNMLYQAAATHLPAHGGCPVIAGISKCVEAECQLALKKDVSITFIE